MMVKVKELSALSPIPPITPHQATILEHSFNLHMQWISLNRSGIVAISTYDFTPLEWVHQEFGEASTYDKEIKKAERALQMINDFLAHSLSHQVVAQGWLFAQREVQRRISRLKEEKKQSKTPAYWYIEKCPDEYWPLFAFKDTKLKYDDTYAQTLSFEPRYLNENFEAVNFHAGSPILWTTTHTKYFIQPPFQTTPVIQTLPQILQFMKQLRSQTLKTPKTKQDQLKRDFLKNSFLFLRKVSDDVWKGLM